YHGIERRDVLVAHDDVELPFGRVVLRRGGGLAGHNGLRSVAQHLSGNDFARLRIGIGRPRHGALSAHVLGAFTPEEEAALEDIERGVEEALGRLSEV
ncbi:MAG: peptidyl-tRNA hydrolase, partial [Spirochaetaceae bacterium]